MSIATGQQILASDIVNKLFTPGMIIIWTGTVATIPTGFVICDGNNGTPNLLSKFVQGVATAVTNPGATGGATSKTTTGHTHTGGSHQHGLPLGYNMGYFLVNGTQVSGSTSTTNTYNTIGGGGNAAQLISDAGGIVTTGSNTDAISDIRPPYYAVAYIMKT